jgi:hypothetical protein
MKGIVLDSENDLSVRVRKDAQGRIAGGLVIGETKIQDAYAVLRIRQGELKEDPVAGVNLERYIRGGKNTANMLSAVRIGLMRVGIDPEDIKSELRIKL